MIPGETSDIEWVREFILGIRQIRGEMDINPSKALPAQLAETSATDRRRVADYDTYLRRLARLDGIEILDAEAQPPRGAATALLGEMRILVPLAGVIDLAAERERLGKLEQRLQKDLKKSMAKLGNAQFRSNAPAEIVAKEEARVADFQQSLGRIRDQLQRLSGLE